LENGLKELPVYVLLEGDSQEGAGEIILISRDKDKILAKYRELDSYYSEIFEVYIDGPVTAMKVEVCEWRLSKGYGPEDKLGTLRNPEETFTKAVMEYLTSLGRSDLGIRFKSLEKGSWRAEIWTTEAGEHDGTFYLNGRHLETLWLEACDWQYQTPGHGAASQCQTEV
jgi:hypothetical protein